MIENFSEINVNLVAAVFSAVATGFAAWAAISSANSAKRALKIAEIAHEEAHQEIKVYLINSFKIEHNQNRYAAFNVSYMNTSTSSNTLSKIELNISYHDDKDERKNSYNVILNSSDEKLYDYDLIKIPVNLAPRSTISGWINFKLPKLLTDKNIDVYNLISISANNEKIQLETTILNERSKS